MKAPESSEMKSLARAPRGASAGSEAMKMRPALPVRLDGGAAGAKAPDPAEADAPSLDAQRRAIWTRRFAEIGERHRLCLKSLAARQAKAKAQEADKLQLGTIEQAVTDLQRHFTEVQANVEGLTKRLGKTQAASERARQEAEEVVELQITTLRLEEREERCKLRQTVEDLSRRSATHKEMLAQRMEEREERGNLQHELEKLSMRLDEMKLEIDKKLEESRAKADAQISRLLKQAAEAEPGEGTQPSSPHKGPDATEASAARTKLVSRLSFGKLLESIEETQAARQAPTAGPLAEGPEAARNDERTDEAKTHPGQEGGAGSLGDRRPASMGSA